MLGNLYAEILGHGLPGAYAKATANTAPTVAKAASLVTAGNVTGKSAAVTVLGNDDGGAANLVYTWKVTSAPSGGSANFSVNGTNAAKSDTITFNKAGTYGVLVTILDAGGLSTASSLQITVAPTLTTIGVFPNGAKTAIGSSTLKVTGSSEALSAIGYDQFGNALTTLPSFTWATTNASGGAAPTMTGKSGGNVTLNFSRAGNYTESVSANAASGAKVSSLVSMNVGAAASSFTVTVVGGSLTVTGTSAQFTVSQFYDQFHNLITTATTLTWLTSTVPSGASAPKFSTSGSTTTATFSSAGKYGFSVTEKDQAGDTVTETITVTVAQTLTSITVTPGTASLKAAGTQQFVAQGYDQFQKAMASQPGFTWTASGGSITSSGNFTAQNAAATDTITAKSGTVSGKATVTVSAPSPSPSPSPSPTPSPGPGPSFQDSTLGKLVASLDADGSLSRSDMLQIFTSVEGGSTVSAADFADLKTIVANSTYYAMPDYVKVLTSDVVSGNAANATYLGASLGNLAAGSSSAQLTKLVGKWFLGADLPTLPSTSLAYATASGSLFPVTPSHNDEYQGELGDCYFISSLGMIADSNTQAIENMFVSNGDGTYTVRFYTSTNVADYVTVNSKLVVFAGSSTLAYSDFYEERRQLVALDCGFRWPKRHTPSGTRQARKAATARTTTARSKAAGWATFANRCWVTARRTTT